MPLPFLSRLAGHLYRSPDEPQSGPEQTREAVSNHLVYGAIMLTLLCLMGDLVSGEASRWKNALPEVPIAKSSWKLLENPPLAECARLGVVGPGCVANPDNPALWKNGTSRFDARGVLKRKAKRDFWVGAELSPAELATALAAGANQFLLGWIYSEFDLFVDGQWFLHGRIEERQATVVPIPLSLLATGRPLRIAVLIHPDSEGGAPDYFAAPWTEGLATAERASAFRSANVFQRSDKPFGLFLVSFVFSLLFFLFWRMQRKKQEYFFLALYGAIGALAQVQNMDLYRGYLDITGTHALLFFLYIGEGGFGFLAALSFARGSRQLFRGAVPVLLAAPWAFLFLPMAVPVRAQLLHQIRCWFVPGCYFLGALACGLQAWHLFQDGRAPGALGARIRQLSLFALGMAMIGGLEICETQNFISLTAQAFTSGFTHFSVVLLLAAIALQEYKAERRILDRSPISKYHRRGTLPHSVRGALLCIDLKDSETLVHESATATGDSGRLIRACLSHMWSAVLAEKGTVLSTEGDGMHAFFDIDDTPNPILAALRAADLMRERLRELSRQLQAQGLHPGGDLSFRGGLGSGEIRPVWQEAGHGKVASWSDCGTGTLFVETARLMDIERQTGGTSRASQVVVGAETAFALRGSKELRGTWVMEGRRFVGKHDQSYLVSVYAPVRPTDEEVELALPAA